MCPVDNRVVHRLALNYLVEEGHAYPTYDKFHFKLMPGVPLQDEFNELLVETAGLRGQIQKIQSELTHFMHLMRPYIS
jgi:hypothetical protein